MRFREDIPKKLLFFWILSKNCSNGKQLLAIGHMAWMPNGVSVNYQWSTFLSSSLVVNLLLQVLLILKQENEGNSKLQRMPFVFALLIQKLPKWTGMQHQFVSKMDLEHVNSENAAILQWCALKPSFVPWLYQTFMIIQDKERAMFLYCSDKEL